MDHSHVLVKYVENSRTYCRIAEPWEIFDFFHHDRRYYISVANMDVIQCDVIMSSNDEAELRAEMDQILAPNISNNYFSYNNQTSCNRKLEKLSPIKEYSAIKKIDENRMITFGPNGTEISALSMREINWKNYKYATYELMREVFTLETLATHTLSGQNRYRRKLDARKVEDIICIVTDKCETDKKAVCEIIQRRCSLEYTKYKHQMEKLKSKKSRKLS